MTEAIKRVLVPLTAIVIGCALPVSAAAAPVMVGSPLLGAADPNPVTSNSTVANITIEAPGAHATSPVSGAVVRWHLLGSEFGPFSLRVLRPAGSSSYTGAGTSSPVVSPGPGLQTFAAALPIRAGDTIGLDVVKGAKVGILSPAPLSSVAGWGPALPEGATVPYTEAGTGAEFTFNAEVQPQPTVSALTPATGSVRGGTAVALTGADFASVSAVMFGTIPASAYTVDSEGQISAIAPPAAAGAANVTVSTVAGTSPVVGGARFTYTEAPHCVVPELFGKKLKAAKKRLAKADCKLGKVKLLNGAIAKTAKVKEQTPKPGKVLAPGARITVKLG